MKLSFEVKMPREFAKMLSVFENLNFPPLGGNLECGTPVFVMNNVNVDETMVAGWN